MRSGISIVAASAAMAIALFHPSPASAQWSVSGSGFGGGAATTTPTGATPTATARSNSVLVAWSAVTLANGTSVTGYVINRYNAVNGSQATVGASCSGTVTATSCTEQSVATGSWVYTDTPVYDNWTGGQSSPSSQVSVP